MKKLYRLAVMLVLAICVTAFTASAETPYNYKGLSFSVPEFLKNDTQWAANANYIYAFCDSETNMEFNVSVYENEGYTYAGLDAEALESYAQSLEESYDAEITVENYRLSDGFSGIKVNLGYAQGEKGVSYWFATDEYCYDLDFVFYNDTYISYAQSIMETVAIYGMPCIDPQSADADGGQTEIQTDSYIYEPVDKSYTYEGLSLTLPEILVEDKNWAQQNQLVSEWITDDMGLEVILNTDINDSPMISFRDFRKSTLEAFYMGFAESLPDTVTNHGWEKIEADGFGGAKLTMTLADEDGYSYNGTVCCFSTSEKLYYVIIFEYNDSYNGYVDGIINSVRIDGAPYTESGYLVICIGILAFIGVVAAVVVLIRKKKEKQDAQILAQMYMPAEAAVPVYYTPDGQAYVLQPQVSVPVQGPVVYQQNTGYVSVPDPAYNNIFVPADNVCQKPAQVQGNIIEEKEGK